MNRRWKTALGFGLIWGTVMSVLWLLYSLQESPFLTIVTSKGFWLRALAYTALGIFPIGYFIDKREKRD